MARATELAVREIGGTAARPRDAVVHFAPTPRAGHILATHPPSLTTSARQSADGIVLVVRPTSIGTERPDVITRAIPASHNMRSSVATGNRPTCSTCARRVSVPTLCPNTSTSITTADVRPVPPAGTRPRRRARRHGTDSTERVRHACCGLDHTSPATRAVCIADSSAEMTISPAFGVEHAVDRHHAVECRRHVQPAPLVTAHTSAAPPSPSIASVTCCTRSRSCFGPTASAASISDDSIRQARPSEPASRHA